MNGLITQARVLKALNRCGMLWRRSVPLEPCRAWRRAICGEQHLNRNIVWQRPESHRVIPIPGILCLPENSLAVPVRHKSSKSSKKGKSKILQEEEDDDDDPEKSDYEDEPEQEDDPTLPKTYKDLEKVVTSFRFDLIMKEGLDTARNKVEDAFYSNKLRLNGGKLLKKSKAVKEGDVLDFIIGEDKETGSVTLMRVVFRKVSEEMTDKDKYRVTLRRWKNLKLPKEECFK
ncbi:mitochondrial transcription rescue factor 1-like [Callorhinchus milii]|uniref:Mitochondrial transcription rescue factor 1 n=1 Tax=Callorhinchus milii TaxID=7868 RepID=V9L7R0_CALMI|nr:mitochondrial transcription rescue factor 1 [Callorhinchus milii]XP_007897297.1 mitochondrial transcription rescue factor 1 [Callorhinchus milii]XP_007897298.1 mitochondrial transcription rescue factor 1 [Callorhinchus milii]XP_042201154.1 mitochondrial transcription rescue factor 1-like [Callorhinchus milii]XP_042201156.1 mitochondrial transcription rescue factor 1-like [Callorhinchus milii]XP_042201157.1 mitochondrial transcription rescue factor 1-like [Callorhinchus milii]|eukprot:gi/632962404/ref/XP_007897296.1/ PREDICTED: uncharacterized protein C6orf203 homolog [Callorhinchus milii]